MNKSKINSLDLSQAVARLVKQANRFLPQDVAKAIREAKINELDEGAQLILDILLENAAISSKTGIPICQDTGIDVVFVEIGPDCVVEDNLISSINQGIAQGTLAGYLRNSVCDPLTRKNTGDNTPAVVHVSYSSTPGLKISIIPKGCGSENMSGLKMLPPSAGLSGIIKTVIEQVRRAGPNPCPPGIIGVGIGGTMEIAALLSKKALLRPVGILNKREDIAELEKRLLMELNTLGIGPQGLGGHTTSLAVAVEVYPCHIASLPVSVNIQCHAARRASARFVQGNWKFEALKDDTRETDSSSLAIILKKAIPIELPLSRKKIHNLKAGDWVKLSGKMLTGRDQTHRRLCELIEAGRPLPIDLSKQFIYYVGPSPAPPGFPIGAAGPTTSYRMDAYTPQLLAQGILGIMGKGKRSQKVVEAIKDYGAVYMATIGGAGAFLSMAIKDSRLLAFEDLGPEALFELTVENFPAIVINDSKGQDYYDIIRPA